MDSVCSGVGVRTPSNMFETGGLEGNSLLGSMFEVGTTFECPEFEHFKFVRAIFIKTPTKTR